MLAVAGLSVLAAVLAVVVHEVWFARGSIDNDEVLYLLQARALAAGHLMPPVPAGVPALAARPWLTVVRDGAYVAKYLPVVPAWFALSLRATGSVVPGLALLAAALPPLVAGVAARAGLSAGEGLAAAALVAVSPLVLVQSGLVLSYVSFLVLLLLAWLLLLGLAQEDGGPRRAVAVGCVAALAACARPYDAVLLLVVPAGWVLVRAGRRGGRLLLAAAVGALPVGLAVAAYDRVATGSALRLPFALLEPSDAVGFGIRRLNPEDQAHDFGLAQGLHGLTVHFGVGALAWTALGAVVLPAAVLGLRRAPAARRVLVASVALLAVGYLPFWGPWNASLLWGGATTVGPFYALPIVVPLAVAAVPVLASLLRRRAVAVRIAVLVLAAVPSVAVAVAAAAKAGHQRERTDAVLAAADHALARGPLQLDADPGYLGHPVTALVDPVAGPARLTLAAHAAVPPPGSAVAPVLHLTGDVYAASAPLGLTVTGGQVLGGAGVEVVAERAAPGSDVLAVTRAGRTTACIGTGPVPLALSAADVTGCAGLPVPAPLPTGEQACAAAGCVTLAWYARVPGGTARVAVRRIPVDVVGDQVRVPVDGPVLSGTCTGWPSLRGPTPPACPRP